MKKLNLVLMLCILLLTGCQQHGKEGINLTLLEQSNQCRVATPTMRLLESKTSIHQVMGLGLMSKTDRQPMNVDFTTQAVVLLAMGEKPSTGYAIKIDLSQMKKLGTELWLPVQFVTPTGDMVATVMTSPCVIFSIEKEGIERIVAGDTGLILDL